MDAGALRYRLQEAITQAVWQHGLNGTKAAEAVIEVLGWKKIDSAQDDDNEPHHLFRRLFGIDGKPL